MVDTPNVIIICKSYTPEKAEYNKKYYQEHKEIILKRQNAIWQRNKDDKEYRERKKETNRRYTEKLRADPEKFERKRQYNKEYYEKQKNKDKLNSIGLRIQ